VDKSPLNLLQQVFGYHEFHENQRETIECVLSGNDAFVLMPTGGGKSLCYQIPAMIAGGVGIVVSPLIALMEDQVKGLWQCGVRAAYLNSTLSYPQVRQIYRRAADGRLDLLYVAPEKLLTPDFQHFLTNLDLALFAIDEAHCVSQWGHDFRPEYLRINEVTRRFPQVPRVALTATADAVTRSDILDKLALQNAEVFTSSFDRPNIRYAVQVKRGDKQQLLQFIREKHPADSGIVYVRTRKRTETIAAWLRENGVSALPYHAGLSSDLRLANQRRFQENETLVMVATIAFGLGVDKPDVRFIAHLDLPASMEAYYQETGRSGRDGQPADALMVYSFADVVSVRRMIESSEGDDAFKFIRRTKLNALLGYCESVECRRKILLNYFGEKYEGACSNCDNCLHPVEKWDGTVAAQKALSCVYRTGQRFGARHLVNVLLGKETPQVRRWSHERIKTFGVGKDLDDDTWMSVFRQLVSAGMLSVAVEDYGRLYLNADSWPVLKGRREVFFRKDLIFGKREKTRPAGVGGRTGGGRDLVDEESRAMFERLRQLRLEIARALKVPPFVIFHDKTLKEMAAGKPTTPEAFRRITGVGSAKAARYSEVFLDCIRGRKIDLSEYSGQFEKGVTH